MSENSHEQKIFNYITALENTNEELLNTLKKCVEVLTHLKPHIADQQGYQDMLDLFHETIKVGERTIEEKIYH